MQHRRHQKSNMTTTELDIDDFYNGVTPLQTVAWGGNTLDISKTTGNLNDQMLTITKKGTPHWMVQPLALMAVQLC